MRNLFYSMGLALIFTALPCWGGIAEEMEATEEEQAEATEQADLPGDFEGRGKHDWISGRFMVDADAKWSKHESDIDLNQTLRLKISLPEHPRLHFYGSLWLHQDLDGHEPRTSALYDLNSAYDSRFRARLSHLYMQVDGVWGNSTLRIGRQRIIESPLYPRVDGVFFGQHNAHWDWYAYLGKRASLYTSAQDDWSTGAGVAWRPSSNTKLALDVAYLDENRRSSEVVRRGLVPRLFRWNYPYEVSRDADTAYVALTLHQAITDNVWGYARVTLHDDDPNEIVLDVLGHAPSMDLTYNVSYRRQLRRVQDQVNDLTVFYRSLGSLETYDHFLATVHKQINPKLAFSLEGELHFSSSNNRFDNNRDYWRLAGIIMLTDIKPGWDVSLALERWDVEHHSGSWVVTGEVSKKWDKWMWKAGVDYEQYRDEIYEYNPTPSFVNQFAVLFIPGVYSRPFTPLIWALDTARVRTREEIYSIYTGVEYALRENQKMTAKVTFEDDKSSESPYWRVQAGYAIDF